jgi:uncharacterized protein involved in type VI secretion and phage assembly
MPEPGDEVMVAFEQGNFDHPYIIGFVWDGEQKPPETDRRNRVLVTPGGHQLRFEDTDGQKKVVVRSSAGHTVTLDDSTKTLSVVTASEKQSLTMNDSAQTTILKGGGIVITLSSGSMAITSAQ